LTSAYGPFVHCQRPARLGPRAKKGVSVANYTSLIYVPGT